MTGMGMDWDLEVTERVLAEWVRWGLARHPAFLRPEGWPPPCWLPSRPIAAPISASSRSSPRHR